jgi:cyanophycin synthetase
MTRGFTALFAGDVGFGEHFMHHPRAGPLQRMLAAEGRGASLAGLACLLDIADVAVANLEAPLSDRPDAGLAGRKPGLAWSTPGPAAAALRAAGFTALSLANDHALDCGREGLAETRRRLARAGIRPFGAGPSAAISGLPYLAPFQTAGRARTLAVFGAFEYRPAYDRSYRWYTNHGLPGVNPLSPCRLRRDIERVRQRLPAPVVVAFPHWGDSYAATSDAQRAAARQLVAAGADVVIGHGAHVAQSFEMIEGRPVIYGLGNCAWNTPGRYRIEGVAPIGLVATLSFAEIGPPLLRLVPILTDNAATGFRSRPLGEAAFARFAAEQGAGWATGRAGGAPCLERLVPLGAAAPRPPLPGPVPPEPPAPAPASRNG